MIDAQAAIGFLIAAGGNSKLAAVRASIDSHDQISEPQLLSLIASDPANLSILAQQIKLLAMLQSLDAFRLTHSAYIEKLPLLGAKDTARAYSDLLYNMAKLSTGSPTNAPDPFETILKGLPPNVAEAVEFFIRNPEEAHNDLAIADDQPAGANSTRNAGYANSPPVPNPIRPTELDSEFVVPLRHEVAA